MENVRKRASGKIDTQEKLEMLVAKPIYVCHKVVRENSM